MRPLRESALFQHLPQPSSDSTTCNSCSYRPLPQNCGYRKTRWIERNRTPFRKRRVQESSPGSKSVFLALSRPACTPSWTVSACASSEPLLRVGLSTMLIVDVDPLAKLVWPGSRNVGSALIFTVWPRAFFCPSAPSPSNVLFKAAAAFVSPFLTALSYAA